MGMAMTRRLWPIALALVLSGCNYNQLVAMQENIASAWSQVENQLQRRNDLIPNLVEVTKGYATHEREIFERIADARARMLASGTRDDKIAAANEVTSALGRLLAIAENYPQLKADAQFARLSDELSGTENRIAVERMRFNDAVREYNATVKSLPTSLYAKFLGFEPQKYFEAPEEAKKVPKVDFGGQAQPKP
jgi:LemA protein